jgi:hypothetical protein
MSSGFSEPNVAGSSTDSNFTTLTYDHLKVQVSNSDVEGWFGFNRVQIEDRATNTVEISYSSGAGSYNRVWIDPVAPVIQSSGFRTILLTSGNEPTTDSGVITQSGVLNGTPIYRISGLLEYDFTTFERHNEITNGENQIRVTIKGSGVGSIPGGNSATVTLFDNGSLLLRGSGATDGLYDYDNFNTPHDTSKYSNGLYVMTVRLEDYVGNVREYQYFFLVENPLYYYNLSLETSQSGLIGQSGVQLSSLDFVLDFSTTFKTSGFIETSGVIGSGAWTVRGIQLTIDRADTQQAFEAGTALSISFESDLRTIVVKYTGSQYLVEPGDVIKITIVADKDNPTVTTLFDSVLEYPLLEPFFNTIDWSTQ